MIPYRQSGGTDVTNVFRFSDEQLARSEPMLSKNTRNPKITIYNRFISWAERGIWENIFSSPAEREPC